jgi:hypothetical protein
MKSLLGYQAAPIQTISGRDPRAIRERAEDYRMQRKEPWQSEGNPRAIRWQSKENPREAEQWKELWQSEGNPMAIRGQSEQWKELWQSEGNPRAIRKQTESDGSSDQDHLRRRSAIFPTGMIDRLNRRRVFSDTPDDSLGRIQPNSRARQFPRAVL